MDGTYLNLLASAASPVLDVPRVLAYVLDVVVFVLAAAAVWRMRRNRCLFRSVVFLPWLVTSACWSIFLLVRGLLGLSGNDTLAAVNGYVRILGPVAVLVLARDGRRHE